MKKARLTLFLMEAMLIFQIRKRLVSGTLFKKKTVMFQSKRKFIMYKLLMKPKSNLKLMYGKIMRCIIGTNVISI